VRDIDLPYAVSCDDAFGSLYHFTADLATGSLRVRPIIGGFTGTAETDVSTRTGPPAVAQTEWTLAEDISDLADYVGTVGLDTAQCRCSLLMP
jgi:hypothetical protein